jgi:hypothetical protein
MNEHDYELSKKIDKNYIVELVRKLNNDSELGREIRTYVMFLQNKD